MILCSAYRSSARQGARAGYDLLLLLGIQDLIPRLLVPIYRWLENHPRVHQLLVRLYNCVVGERRLAAAVRRIVQPGDCVWDIGANVGVYTRQFLQYVGPSGHVVAVEPVPEHIDQLRQLGGNGALTVVAAALAASDGEMSFVVDGQESHIGDGPGAVSVRVARGDTLLAEGVRAPDVLKIDVEGFEGDVIDGMPTALSNVRAMVVEVHFAALTRRERPADAARIVDLLRGVGFSVRWLDSTHLSATRQLLR